MAIQINFVPDNLRKRKKSSTLSLKGFQLPREVVIGLVGGLIGLLVFVHVVLQAFIIFQYVQLHRYRSAQKSFVAKKAQTENVLQDLRRVQSNLALIDNIATNRKVYWAPILSALSENLTRGVWLERMTVQGKKFSLSGSAVSKTAAEMIEVTNFATKLKASPAFSKNFSKIELGPMKTRKVSTTTVADFELTGTMK